MIGLKFSTIQIDDEALKSMILKSEVAPVRRCALLVERAAKISMRKGGRSRVGLKSGKASTPPDPPNVQTGNLRNSITFAIIPIRRGITQGVSAIVGPTRTAWYGKIHEYGGEFGGRNYPARPFMRPALARVQSEFANEFRGAFHK